MAHLVSQTPKTRRSYCHRSPNLRDNSGTRKLRKRAPFLYLEKNCASLDLSQLSYEEPETKGSRPGSLRHLGRPLHGESLECLEPKDFRDGVPPVSGLNQPRDSQYRSYYLPTKRTTPAKTVCDVPSSQIPQYPINPPAYPTVHPTAPYDRCSSLAESYRALLPNLSTINYDQAANILHKEGKSQSQRTQLDYRGFGERVQRREVISTEQSDSPGQRAPNAASSTLAIGANGNQTRPRSVHCNSNENGMLLDRKPRSWSPKTAPRSDYVGLQICLDLLTAELAGVLFKQHPVGNCSKGSKLQILLLIEAYEALIQECRRHVLKLDPGDIKRRHIHDAIRVLDHWLNSLYSIYDEAFLNE